jgi:hypothetical protein
MISLKWFFFFFFWLGMFVCYTETIQGFFPSIIKNIKPLSVCIYLYSKSYDKWSNHKHLFIPSTFRLGVFFCISGRFEEWKSEKKMKKREITILRGDCLFIMTRVETEIDFHIKIAFLLWHALHRHVKWLFFRNFFFNIEG